MTEEPTPPVNVRAVMPNGLQIPIECRYEGWNGIAHVWRSTRELVPEPVNVVADVWPDDTSIIVDGMTPKRSRRGWFAADVYRWWRRRRG